MGLGPGPVTAYVCDSALVPIAGESIVTKEDLKTKHAALLTECFDFSPPAGWLVPVDKALTVLGSMEPLPSVLQVKNKWATLQIYMGPGIVDAARHKIIHDAISEAASACASLCQVCGAPGARHPDRAMIVCDDHAV